MTFEELKAQNTELPALQNQLNQLRDANEPGLEAEAKAVEGKRLEYLLTSYNKTPEEEAALKHAYESALSTHQNNLNTYHSQANEIDSKIASIEQQLREQSSDQNPLDQASIRIAPRGGFIPSSPRW